MALLDALGNFEAPSDAIQRQRAQFHQTVAPLMSDYTQQQRQQDALAFSDQASGIMAAHTAAQAQSAKFNDTVQPLLADEAQRQQDRIAAEDAQFSKDAQAGSQTLLTHATNAMADYAKQQGPPEPPQGPPAPPDGPPVPGPTINAYNPSGAPSPFGNTYAQPDQGGGALSGIGDAIASVASPVLQAVSHGGLPSMDPSLTGGTPGTPPNMSNQPAMQSYVPPSALNAVRDVSPAAADVIGGVTSPVGIAGLAAAPLDVGVAGALGSVAAGQTADTLGASSGVRMGAEALGGLAAGGLAGMGHAPEVPPIADTGIATAPASGGMPPEMQGVPMSGGATIPPDVPPSAGDTGAAPSSDAANVPPAVAPTTLGANAGADFAPATNDAQHMLDLAQQAGVPTKRITAIAAIAGPNGETTPEMIAASAEAKMQAILKTSRSANVELQGARSAEVGARANAGMQAYNDAIARGMGRAEANSRFLGKMAGAQTPGGTLPNYFTDAEAEYYPQQIDARFNAPNVPSSQTLTYQTTQNAYLKLLAGAHLQPAELDKLQNAVPALGRAARQAQSAGVDVPGMLYNGSQIVKQLQTMLYMPRLALTTVWAGPQAGLGKTIEALTQGLQSARGDLVAQAFDAVNRGDSTPLTLLSDAGNARTTTVGDFASQAGGYRSLGFSGAQASEYSSGPQLLADIPGLGQTIKAPMRITVTVENSLRRTLISNALKGAMDENGAVSEARAQAIVNWANRATFRGTLGGQLKVPGIIPGIGDMPLSQTVSGDNPLVQPLNTLMWTPKANIAPVQNFLTLLHSDPYIAGLAAKQLGKTLTLGIALMGLAKLAGADVGTSSGADFGKIVYGDHHINVFGPAQRIARTAYQIATNPSNAGPVMTNYARSLLNPLASLPVDILKGADYLGNPVSLSSTSGALQVLTDRMPIIAQSIRDSFNSAWSNPSPANIAVSAGTSALTMLGGRGETYPNPRGDLASAFKQQVGHDYNPESPGDKAIVAANPNLAQLAQAAQSPGTTDYKTATAGMEQASQLPKLAQAVNSGDPLATKAFSSARHDFLIQRSQFGNDTFPNSPAPSSDVGKLVNQYYAVTPDQFSDASGIVDWNAYDAARKVISDQMTPEDAKAIQAGPKFQDPTIQAANDKYEAAVAALRQVQALPKYRGMTAPQSANYTKFLSEIPQVQQSMSRLKGFAVAPLLAAKALATSLGDSSLFKVYQVMGQIPAGTLTNPDRVNALMTNQAALSQFYPGYYNLVQSELAGQIKGRSYKANTHPEPPAYRSAVGYLPSAPIPNYAGQ